MRITAISAAVALALVSVSTSLYGQRPDDQIDARSVALVKQGESARAAGNLEAAIDSFETALAVDPRNRQAFIGEASAVRAQGMSGKAIRLYREALKLEPNDLAALRGQGEAMMEKGAVKSAQENLAQIRKVCGDSCAEADKLAAVIAKGPPATATAEQTVKPKPDTGEE